MFTSRLGISIVAAAVVLVVTGILWGGKFFAPQPREEVVPVAPPAPVDPVALEKEIEDLRAMQNHLLPPLPARNPDVLQAEQGAGAVKTPASGGAPQLPAQAKSSPSYTYTYSAPQANSSSPSGNTYTYNSSYSYSPSYGYSSTYGPSSPQSATSTPPAPIFTAAPGTRTYTVTTNKRFCEYVKGNSQVFLSGYPFSQDLEIYSQDILKWAMTSVTFRLPPSFPIGTYAVTVRGYQKYGYCDDVRPGFIKVQ